jgi:molybdate transport system substrate-binding protein
MPPHRRQLSHRAVLGLLALAMVFAGCQEQQPGQVAESSAVASCADTEQSVVIFAASSLRDAFGAIAEEFKREHAGSHVTFNFAGSQELRTQVEQGARADVFASADQKHMSELVSAGLAESPVVFARNEPVLVVATEAVRSIRALADLPNAARIVVGTPEVPIGRYTLQILDLACARLGTDFRSRVEARVVSRELNVKQVLAKVSLGEAQAGIVYRSDARAAKGSVGTVDIPRELNVIAEYPIAVMSDAPHRALAQAWVSFVRSAKGQHHLKELGFLSPPEGAAAP